jgi:tripartite-type tricarboxylate transporter receptor subunit TctC
VAALRRNALRAALAIPASLLAVRRRPLAASYPARPVRLVTGFAPGGPMDIVARIVAGWLSERLGQTFVVENRPGAGGNIGTEYVVRAPADGYTLLLCGPVNTINAALYERLPFDFARDIVPVAGIVHVPLVMVVHPAVPAATPAEFIALARRPGGRLAMASAGNGTPQHVAGELFKLMTGSDLLHVPYRGSGPALTDLLAGQVQVMFDAMPSAIGHVRAGRLRALAVTTSSRAEALPDVPSLAELLPGYEASSWYGIGAPAGTPPDVVDTLNAAVNAGLADPAMRMRLAELGGTALPGPPAELGSRFLSETAKWGRVVRGANIRLD